MSEVAAGEAELIDGASRGDVNLVSAEIALGTNLETRGRRGWTPLMFAASLGHTGVVRALLRAGADPNVRADEGSTPLIGAAVGGHAEAVDLLIAAGSDPDVANLAGATARIKAEQYGHLDVVERLDRAQAPTTRAVPAQLPAAADEASPPIDGPALGSAAEVAVEPFDAVYLVVQEATFRSLPSFGAPVAGQLPAGFSIKVTGKVRGADWYRVGPADIAVWVPGQVIERAGNEP